MLLHVPNVLEDFLLIKPKREVVQCVHLDFLITPQVHLARRAQLDITRTKMPLLRAKNVLEGHTQPLKRLSMSHCARHVSVENTAL